MRNERNEKVSLEEMSSDKTLTQNCLKFGWSYKFYKQFNKGQNA